ncbi:MAG: exopolyphosphatase [Deltaproteobacteria bacterium]|nr:exopolyphosphatase [Deltaproteobacteria bacterium]
MSASTPATGHSLAAVDLGSNSFHLVIARVLGGELSVVDRLRESVRLAGGLGPGDRLNDETIERAVAALGIFGQRIGHMPVGSVRAVGTSTLRKASNAGDLLERARTALGHPIEVVSGREEARLIYLGVAHSIADNPGRRLVIDIGGGSTECIIGERFEPLLADSLDMGCVRYTARFFADGELSKTAFSQAETAAGLELQPIERRYRRIGWEHAVGSSGTVESIAAVLHETGWGRGGITASGLDKLKKALLQAGKVSRVQLPGLRPDRAAVLSAGVAILAAAFEALHIQRMTVSEGAMREGVLYDLLGRIRHEDMRDRTIAALGERWHVDVEQAGRVERTALQLWKLAQRPWDLGGDGPRQLLAWAARLHEVGLAVAYSGYHKHGAYLVAESDMAGFSRDEQRAVAELIRGHRRKLAPSFKQRQGPTGEATLRLTVLLRLAVLLERARSSKPLPTLGVECEKQGLLLKVPQRWLDEHPLTFADLQREREDLAEVGFDLQVRGK